MSSLIPPYLREAARLLSQELIELREFSTKVLQEITQSPVDKKEATVRKYSRELAGRYHRAQGAAAFLQLGEFTKFAKSIEDLFRSVQEQRQLDPEVFTRALHEAAHQLAAEAELLQREIAV